MDNYQAIAYAWVAVYQLQNENEEIAPSTVAKRMTYLMDMKSETEIEKLKQRLSNK